MFRVNNFHIKTVKLNTVLKCILNKMISLNLENFIQIFINFFVFSVLIINLLLKYPNEIFSFNKTDKYEFVDIYGIDNELLQLVPRPVIAVLLLFPVHKNVN